MSTISIFSYVLIFSVMITNVFSGLNKLNSIYLVLGIVFAYLGLSLYFTDLMYHDSFMGILILTLQLIYNIYLVKEKRTESSNLYINVSSFLLPLYLLSTQSCWDHVIIITLIEILRIVSSSDKSKEEAKSTLLNYISANLKIFVMILSTIIAVSITKTDLFSDPNNIQELYIGIPIVIFYILSFVYTGGLNSTVVENNNINNLKSKNILSYISIYKVIIPYVLILNSKNLISKSSYDIYVLIDEVLIVALILMTLYFVWIYIKSPHRNIKLTAVQNISLLPMSFMFLTNDVIDSKEYLLYLIMNSLLFSFIILIEQYQVSFKKISLWTSKLIFFNSPLSPLLFLNLYFLSKFKVLYSDFVSLLLFVILILPSLWIVREIKSQSKVKTKKYNNHANSRLIFIVLCAIIIIVNYNL